MELINMSANAKRAIVYLLGGLGFISLLLGVIGNVYSTTTGIILMFVFGVIAGFLARYWGLKKGKDS
ncbi:hypothetical protein ACFLUU_01230 [Chloroflexota bacterium]